MSSPPMVMSVIAMGIFIIEVGAKTCGSCFLRGIMSKDKFNDVCVLQSKCIIPNIKYPVTHKVNVKCI